MFPSSNTNSLLLWDIRAQYLCLVKKTFFFFHIWHQSSGMCSNQLVAQKKPVQVAYKAPTFQRYKQQELTGYHPAFILKCCWPFKALYIHPFTLLTSLTLIRSSLWGSVCYSRERDIQTERSNPEYLISRQLILLSEQKLPEMIKGEKLPDICFYHDVTAYK